MFTSRRSIQGMDSDDSQDGSQKARSSSSDSNSSRSPTRRRSSSSDRNIKQKSAGKDYGPRSPSPRGPESPDQVVSNLSTQDSENNSPNSRPSYTATGPKTPDSNGSREASPISRISSRGPKTPASPSSPTPDSPRGPRSPQSGNTSPSSPINRSRNNWSPRSDSQSRRSRSGSANSDRSRPHRAPRSPDSAKSRGRNTSSSSRSSRDSSPPKRRHSIKDPATEEVSDGEMDSEQEDKRLGPRSPSEEKKINQAELNISHEDLSDVSDLDSVGPNYDDDKTKKSPIRIVPTDTGNKDLEKSKDIKVNGNFNVVSSPPLLNGSVSDPQKFEKFSQEKTSRTEDVEEQLDFEAEEGECLETPEPILNNGEQDKDIKTGETKTEGVDKSDSELEEGEVSDEGERRPEEVEPRPICRFYSRGQCTWGINCRFLHPGVTDKGNYTMFDMVRAMPGGGGPMMHGRPPPHMHPAYREVMPHALPPPQPTESAWERGLRTAKEMLRLASKRREQEGAEFEEKRLHLSAAATAGVVSTDADPDALYVSAAAVGASPPQRPTSPPHQTPSAYPHHYREAEYYGRPGYEERYAAVRGSRREAAPHRAQAYYDERERYDDRLRYDERQRYEDRVKYEERASPNDDAHHAVKRRARTTREVIVQRAPTAERDRERAVPSGRADDWADPWMRSSGATATTRNRHKRSASSHTSYSTSSSSRSSSRSSRSSRGRPAKKKASISARPRRAALSPSVIVRERRAAVARATAMNPPAPSPHRRRVPSPAAERALAATNPPPPTSASNRRKVADYGRGKPTKPVQRTKKRYSRSSSSGSDSSTSSSESDSDSRSSSSSRSSSGERRRGGKSAPNRRAPAMGMAAAAVRVPAKSFSAASQGKKEITDMKDISGKKRSAPSPVNNSAPAKKPVSRREELLKQLKAVEDAIARKRSKI